jgi:hypothetical protein
MSTVDKLVELFCSRRAIEGAFRSAAATIAKKGDPDGANLFRKMIESDVVEAIMADAKKVLCRQFTEEELQALYEWHSSPLAKKVAAITPKINAEITRLSEDHIMNEVMKEHDKGNI